MGEESLAEECPPPGREAVFVVASVPVGVAIAVHLAVAVVVVVMFPRLPSRYYCRRCLCSVHFRWRCG